MLLFTVRHVLSPLSVSYCWFSQIIAPQTSNGSRVIAVRTAKYLMAPWQYVLMYCAVLQSAVLKG